MTRLLISIAVSCICLPTGATTLTDDDRQKILSTLFSSIKGAKVSKGSRARYDWEHVSLKTKMKQARLEGERTDATPCGDAEVFVHLAIPTTTSDRFVIVTSTDCSDNLSHGGGAFIGTVPMAREAASWKKAGEYKFRFEQGNFGGFGGTLAAITLSPTAWGLVAESGFTNMGTTMSVTEIFEVSESGALRSVALRRAEDPDDFKVKPLSPQTNDYFDLEFTEQRGSKTKTFIYKYNGKRYQQEPPAKGPKKQ